MHGEHWFVRAAYSLRLSPPNTQTQRMLVKVQFLCSSEKKCYSTIIVICLIPRLYGLT